jgi:hypothetical protein
MAATGLIGPCHLRDNMNAEHYLQVLEGNVWPIVSDWENIDRLVFMHDGPPPHFALSVRAWLDQKFPGHRLEEGFGTLSPTPHTTSC